MPLGLRVSHVERLHESLQGRLVGILDLLAGGPQLPGAFGDPHLELLLVGAVLLNQTPLFPGALDDDLDLLEIERFGEVIAGAQSDSLDRRRDVHDARHHHHVDVRIVRLDGPKQLDSRLPRHLDVRQDEVDPSLAGLR